MKLSTKGRYGVRAMLDLAIHATKEHVSLKSVAERQEMSELYLEQLMSTLRKAGLIKSIRGAQGGYVLTMKPSEITVGMILRVLEGSLAPVECVEGDAACSLYSKCVTRKVWSKLHESITKTVDSFTLKDLVDEYYALNNEDANFMYYI